MTEVSNNKDVKKLWWVIAIHKQHWLSPTPGTVSVKSEATSFKIYRTSLETLVGMLLSISYLNVIF